MKKLILLAMLLGSLTHQAISAQTNLSPQPAAAQSAPCVKPAPPRKPSWLETKAKALACKHNPNLCDIPSDPAQITGVSVTPDAKPCPPPTSSQAAPVKQTVPVSSVPPASVAGGQPGYVCPPHTALIPGTAYCLAADHSTVDAIALPPNMTAPAKPIPQPATPTKPITGGSAALPRSFRVEGGFLSPRYEDILDRPILYLSESDYIDVRAACEGIVVFGSPGSGKSSCSGRQLAMGMLRVPHMGGLILTAKAEETQNWLRYAKECGREQDVIVFNAEGPHCFDLLHYEWTRPGRGSADLEGIIDLFSSLLSNGKKESSHGDGLFFERATEQLMRNVIVLLDLAGEPVSIVSIDRVIKSLPTQTGEYENAAWQKDAYCAQLINKIRERQDTLTSEQWSDLDMASHYMFIAWPQLDERPRTSIAMTWSGMADRFLFSPYNRLFCSGTCTFTPEMTTHEGKIIICDFPLLQCGHETGATVNKLLKLSFTKAWLRRDLSESANPVFLWQDEFQYFITRKDNFFQQTCRGSRVAVVCLTQNILNLSEELNEPQPGSKTKSYIGNLGTRIYHQQNCTETSLISADQIGREYRYLDNYSGGGSSDSPHSHFSSGGSRQLVHIVEPIAFQRLIKPTSTNLLAQAIVYQSGKIFNASKTERNPKGSNYLSVFFSRA